VTAVEKPEKPNEGKKHSPYYRVIDDDTIINLKKYYKLEDHDELLRFVKKHLMNGDAVLE
jgi:hypothetical protein